MLFAKILHAVVLSNGVLAEEGCMLGTLFKAVSKLSKHLQLSFSFGNTVLLVFSIWVEVD